MSHEFARRMLREFKHAGVLSVTWTGGGEPTLHPDFDAILVDTVLAGLEQGVYTHGGHVDSTRAEVMKTMCEFVYVSLDAADRQTYKQLKVADRFDAACEGITNLAKADGKAAIGVGFLITKDNWREAFRMRELALDLGADYCQFRPTIYYDHDEPGKLVEDTAWLRFATYFLETLKALPGVELDLHRFKRYADWSGHGYTHCYWAALQSVVTPNGKMWTCVNKREHPAELLGDLSEESFSEIWARHSVPRVNENCRLLCRGDVANQTLSQVMQPVKHAAFP
jgi:MoaA/NifB/PqqE/SkfB family radical SAM enzyme